MSRRWRVTARGPPAATGQVAGRGGRAGAPPRRRPTAARQVDSEDECPRDDEHPEGEGGNRHQRTDMASDARRHAAISGEPSTARSHSRQPENLLSPTARGARASSTTTVRNPSQATMPFMSGLRSGSRRGASAKRRPIRRELPTSSGVATSPTAARARQNIAAAKRLGGASELLSMRRARTTSAPSRQRSTRARISSGGSCRSASMRITPSPRVKSRLAPRAASLRQSRDRSSRRESRSARAWGRREGVFAAAVLESQDLERHRVEPGRHRHDSLAEEVCRRPFPVEANDDRN